MVLCNSTDSALDCPNCVLAVGMLSLDDKSAVYQCIQTFQSQLVNAEASGDTLSTSCALGNIAAAHYAVGTDSEAREKALRYHGAAQRVAEAERRTIKARVRRGRCA